ncbi:MAG: hypothetical protein KDE50_10445, partial [Caldilineaceae bacterium]|nr:hypothetical protein [Caldilineaceae bacterium]
YNQHIAMALAIYAFVSDGKFGLSPGSCELLINRSEIRWQPNLSGLEDLTGLNLRVVFER